MFGKWFDSAYTGSLAGSGADVFAVWTYAVAHAWNGSVELNPLVVAGLIGMPVENVERAIGFLCQPDPKSRNPDREGRRLVYENSFRYEVVSQPVYREKRNHEERREYMRVKQQESRARKSTKIDRRQPPSTAVNHCQPPLAQSEPEREEELKAKAKASRGKREGAKTKTDEHKSRHAEFKAAIGEYWKSKNPTAEMPWNGAEGKNLDVWLRASPGTALDQFKNYLRSRYRSDVNHAERPSKWIHNITDFASGPLDRFGQPLNAAPTIQLPTRPPERN